MVADELVEGHAALDRLVVFLKSRGAVVKIVYFPGAKDGEKVVYADHLVARRSVEELVAMAEDGLKRTSGMTWLNLTGFGKAGRLTALHGEPFFIRGLVVGSGK